MLKNCEQKRKSSCRNIPLKILCKVQPLVIKSSPYLQYIKKILAHIVPAFTVYEAVLIKVLNSVLSDNKFQALQLCNKNFANLLNN